MKYEIEVVQCGECGQKFEKFVGENWTSCRDCREAEFSVFQKQAKLKKESNLPQVTYIPAKGNPQLLQWVRDNKDCSLFIASACSGVGKTRAIIQAGYEIIDLELKSVFYATVPALCRTLVELFFESFKRANGFMDKLFFVDILILDDFGKEKLTDRAGESLFEVIDQRYLNERSTWITSNYSGMDLARRLGDRGEYIRRRIRELYKIKILSEEKK